MIVERIFTQKSEALIPLCTTLEDRQFDEIEENAIYYAAGYIITKLIWKYEKTSGENSKLFINALWRLSHNEHVKIWIKAKIVEGYKHISNDTFNCFKAIEVLTYHSLRMAMKRNM